MDFVWELTEYLSLLKGLSFIDNNVKVELNDNSLTVFKAFCKKTKVKFTPCKIGVVKKFLKSKSF